MLVRASTCVAGNPIVATQAKEPSSGWSIAQSSSMARVDVERYSRGKRFSTRQGFGEKNMIAKSK